MTIVGIMLFAAATAGAREVRFVKKVDAGQLQSELRAAGYSISWIECSADRCRAVMPDSEKKDPMPLIRRYVYVDAGASREKRRNEMEALSGKWDLGTITQNEKDELLRMLVQAYLGK